MTDRRWRPAAAAVAATAFGMTAVYVAVMRSQGSTPLVWVMAGLLLSGTSSLYAVRSRAAYGPAALGLAGCVLVVIGVLGILTIGLPLLVAGIAAMISAQSGRRGARG